MEEKSTSSQVPHVARFPPDHGQAHLVKVVTLIQEFPLFRPDVHASYGKALFHVDFL